MRALHRAESVRLYNLRRTRNAAEAYVGAPRIERVGGVRRRRSPGVERTGRWTRDRRVGRLATGVACDLIGSVRGCTGGLVSGGLDLLGGLATGVACDLIGSVRGCTGGLVSRGLDLLGGLASLLGSGLVNEDARSSADSTWSPRTFGFPPAADTGSDGTNRGEQRNEPLDAFSFRRFDAIAFEQPPQSRSRVLVSTRYATINAAGKKIRLKMK